MMTTAVSKPSINIKCVSEAKQSVNLALNTMKKKTFFSFAIFWKTSIIQKYGFFSVCILGIDMNAIKVYENLFYY